MGGEKAVVDFERLLKRLRGCLEIPRAVIGSSQGAICGRQSRIKLDGGPQVSNADLDVFMFEGFEALVILFLSSGGDLKRPRRYTGLGRRSDSTGLAGEGDNQCLRGHHENLNRLRLIHEIRMREHE